MHSILLSELLLSPCPLESAFKLIAANDTRRCTSCFTWYVDLDCPKTSSSFLQGLYVLERCSKGLPRDVCPLCYQESIDQAIAKKRRARNAHQHLHQTEQHPKALAATLNLKTSLPPYTRRYLARRDVELYQALRDSGSNLPALPARCRHDEGIESLLNLKQERALFLALQDLGAFRYPGMAENMRDREGRTLPDGKYFFHYLFLPVLGNADYGSRENLRDHQAERLPLEHAEGLGQGGRTYILPTAACPCRAQDAPVVEY